MVNDKPNPEGTKLNPKDVYATLVQLGIHGQDNKLNLLSSFLFFQSVLLLAWATVWQIECNAGRVQILHAFSFFGTLSSIVWFVLGLDYADASKQYSKAAEDLERHFENGLPRPLTERHKKLDDKSPLATSKFLIGLVTLGFVTLYPVLEFILCKSH